VAACDQIGMTDKAGRVRRNTEPCGLKNEIIIGDRLWRNRLLPLR